MSESVFDNFLEIFGGDEEAESGEYKNDNNCFDLEDKIELTFAVMTNTAQKMSQVFALFNNIDGVDDCDDFVPLVNSIDDFVNDSRLLSKLNEIVMCFIFSNMDFDGIFTRTVATIDNPNVKNVLQGIEDYKTIVDNLPTDELDEMDELDEETFEELDSTKHILNIYLSEFLESTVLVMQEEFGLSDEMTEKLDGAISGLDIEDFLSIEDLKETIKGVFKSVYTMDSENKGIIGEDDYIRELDFKGYVDVFTNTYYSIFEWLLLEYSIDFSDIESFIQGYDETKNKQLRFIFYIMDSFKIDIRIFKAKFLQNLIFNKIYTPIAGGAYYRLIGEPSNTGGRWSMRGSNYKVDFYDYYYTMQNTTGRQSTSPQLFFEGFNEELGFCDGMADWQLIPTFSKILGEHFGRYIMQIRTGVKKLDWSTRSYYWYLPETFTPIANFSNDYNATGNFTYWLPYQLNNSDVSGYELDEVYGLLFGVIEELEYVDELDLIVLNENIPIVEVIEDFIEGLSDDISDVINDIFE